MPGRCFTRYTGFRWGSRSPINWLYWLTRCGPQPLQRISASWYRPVHHLGLCALPTMLAVPRIHTELARCAFSVAAPSTWNSLPADIQLCNNILTFKCHLKTHLFKHTSSSCAASRVSVSSDLKALYKSVIIIYYYYLLVSFPRESEIFVNNRKFSITSAFDAAVRGSQLELGILR